VAQELVRRFDSTQGVHGAESPNGAPSTDAREGRA